jgi:predicted PurR-regulated permease PerM
MIQDSNISIQSVGKVFDVISASGSALLGVLASLSLVPVVTFYLLRDWDDIVLKVKNLIPARRVNWVEEIVLACDEVLSSFIRGQLVVMLALAVIYSVGLGIGGLDLALLAGTVAGLASIVPYLGVIVGVLVGALAALTQMGPEGLIIVAVVFTSGQLLESFVLTPYLVGDKIGLHPVVVIFVLMAGGQLLGFTGVLIALPVSAVLAVLLKRTILHYKQSEWFNRSADFDG